MSDQSEAARETANSHWFGLDRLRLGDGDRAIDVTIGSEQHWDRAHLRRLRQSGDLPGLVPVIDADFSADGKPFAITPVVDEPSLTSLIQSGTLDWTAGAAITEAAARAAHEAHLRGLYHGALTPDDVYVAGDDVALAGIGLGMGGVPPVERAAWVAPEVRQGAEPSERSDVYSLGKILEQSLGDSLETVPRSVRRLIMWSSSDTPEARPPSAMEFASILAEGLGEDRTTYGPAFISTAEVTELVSQASSAVSQHTLSPTALTTAAAASTGMAATGLAAATSAYLAGTGAGPKPEYEPVYKPEAAKPENGVKPEDIDAGARPEDRIKPEDDVKTEDLDADAEPEDEPPLADDLEGDLSTDIDPGVELDTGADPEAGTGTDQPDPLGIDGAVTTTEITDPDLGGSDGDADAGTGAALDIDRDAVAGAGAGAGDETDVTDDGEPDLAGVVPAAETAEFETANGSPRRNNRAGIAIGAILALGLVAIIWGLVSSGGDEDGAEPEQTSATEQDALDEVPTNGATSDVTATAAGTAATSDDASATSESPATGDAGAATADDPATDGGAATGTDGATAGDTEVAAGEETAASDGAETAAAGEASTGEASAGAGLAATADGPITASEAGVQVLQGLPGTEVDAYVDGDAIAAGFEAGSIAGPIDLAPGEHDIELFTASESAPTEAADRSEDPLTAATVQVGDEPLSVIVHLDANGATAITPFAEDLGELQPGRGRLTIRNLMAGTDPVDASVDGTVVGSLAPSEELSVSVDAGNVEVELIGSGGQVIDSITRNVDDGEAASLTAVGAPADGTAEIVTQQFTGLDSAPVAVPTGDSGLLGNDGSQTNLWVAYGLMVALVICGGFVAIRRQRSWS